jgi:cysteine desulfurase
MSNLAVNSLRQATRLCVKQPGLSVGLLRSPAPRVAAVSSQKISRRGYVSETKTDNAQVNIDTAIRADQKAFVQQVGNVPENQAVPGTTVNADAMMSPMAGMCHSSETLKLLLMVVQVFSSMLPLWTKAKGRFTLICKRQLL